ncbi:MAG: M15 family metallopeptidase [Treponema sp.]|jgi:D-alanyl-D-alanine carboxypeptidase|nr:M15 family metallopeptidase [Treponema sp.]
MKAPCPPRIAGFVILFFLLAGGASWTAGAQNVRGADTFTARLEAALLAAGVPGTFGARIKSDPAFPAALSKILAGDPYLRILVDKTHPLPGSYEPSGLVPLTNKSYRLGIADTMLLWKTAEEALEEMAFAAKAEGVDLIVSSAYRSYEYQIGSFDRWSRRLGPVEAEKISARPGKSQHQLGLVVDFGSITNEFAETRAGRWVNANAPRFGWSLSYPSGYENITGYSWESWHFRYVGKPLAGFIDDYFGGLQHYALTFLYAWERR